MKLFREFRMMRLLQSCDANKLILAIELSQRKTIPNKRKTVKDLDLPEETLGKYDYKDDEEIILKNPYEYIKELTKDLPELENIDSYKKLTLGSVDLPDDLEKVFIANSSLPINQCEEASKMFYRGEKDELLIHMIDVETFVKSVGDKFSSILKSIIEGAREFISDSLINIYSFNSDGTRVLLNSSTFTIKLETETNGMFILAGFLPVTEWLEGVIEEMEDKGEMYVCPNDCYTKIMVELVGKLRGILYEFQDALEEYVDLTEEEMDNEELARQRIEVSICNKIRNYITNESEFKGMDVTIAFGRL